MARTRQALEPQPHSPTPADDLAALPHIPLPSRPPTYTPHAAAASLFIEPGSNPTILPLMVNSLEELHAAQVPPSNPDPLAEAVDSNQDPLPPLIHALSFDNIPFSTEGNASPTHQDDAINNYEQISLDPPPSNIHLEITDAYSPPAMTCTKLPAQDENHPPQPQNPKIMQYRTIFRPP